MSTLSSGNLSAAPPPVEPPTCLCGAPMVRRRSTITDHLGRLKPDYWRCISELCGRSVGSHANGTPLGIPADSNTRKSRRAAHAVLDQIWKKRLCGLNRHDVYGLVQYLMDLPEEEAHVAMFDRAQCRRLIAALVGLFPELVTEPSAAGGAA